MATRTAPLATASATSRQLTIRSIDASGDFWAEGLSINLAASAAEIEALVAAYQATTKTSVYEIQDTLNRTGVASSANADTGLRASGANGVNYLFKNSAGLTQPIRQIAPVDATMDGDLDIPLVDNALITTLVAAVIAVKTGFALARAQYTERRERKNNPVIR